MSKILLAMIAGILILCSCSSPKSNDIPVIITDSEHIILSAIQTETITNRLTSDMEVDAEDPEE